MDGNDPKSGLAGLNHTANLSGIVLVRIKAGFCSRNLLQFANLFLPTGSAPADGADARGGGGAFAALERGSPGGWWGKRGEEFFDY